MSRPLLAALATGALSGLTVVTSVLAGIAGIPLLFIALVPTFAVGLSLGFGTVLVALGAATVFAWLAGSVILGATSGFYMGLNYLIAFAIPQGWLIRLTLLSRDMPSGRQWYPPGRLLAWVVGIAAAFVGAAEIAFWGSEGGLAGAIQGPELEEAVHAVGQIRGQSLDDQEVTQMASLIARVMPAMAAYSWMVMIIVNGLLAQALLARSGRNLRPPTAFADLQLPIAMLYIFGGALVLSFLPDPLGALGGTVVAVVTFAYLILGLAVIHALVRRSGARQFLLFGVYLLLVIMWWLAILVALLGLVEQGIGLRKRLFAAGKGREEE
jgi:hypothetical protein